MPNAMNHKMRHHADGSVDVDFYRAAIAARRRQAPRDAATLLKAFAGVLVTVAVLALTSALASWSRQAGPAVAGAPASEQAQLSHRHGSQGLN